MLESKRYLGVELAGAKNQKTSVAVLEYFPKESKVFLLDIFDRISGHKAQTGDQALLEVIGEMQPGITRLGVNVALELPPCIQCTRKTCPQTSACGVTTVKWMRDFTRKTAKADRALKIHEFTPYTQRPVELWVRYNVLPQLGEFSRFEVDETLGGNLSASHRPHALS